MRTPVNNRVAKKRRKPRNRDVQQNKTSKAEALLTPKEKQAFAEACDYRAAKQGAVLRKCALQYTEDVQAEMRKAGKEPKHPLSKV